MVMGLSWLGCHIYAQGLLRKIDFLCVFDVHGPWEGGSGSDRLNWVR